jgi:hypothetical protein
MGRRIMHGEVRGEVVLSPLASVEPYGRNTTKTNNVSLGGRDIPQPNVSRPRKYQLIWKLYCSTKADGFVGISLFASILISQNEAVQVETR